MSNDSLTILLREAALLLPSAAALRVEQTESHVLLSVETPDATWFASVPGQHLSRPGPFTVPASRARWALADTETPFHDIRFTDTEIEILGTGWRAAIGLDPSKTPYPTFGEFSTGFTASPASLTASYLPHFLATLDLLKPRADTTHGIGLASGKDGLNLLLLHPRLIARAAVATTKSPDAPLAGLLSVASARILLEFGRLWNAAGLPTYNAIGSDTQLMLSRELPDGSAAALLLPMAKTPAIAIMETFANPFREKPNGVTIPRDMLEKIRKMYDTTGTATVHFGANGMISVQKTADAAKSTPVGAWANPGSDGVPAAQAEAGIFEATLLALARPEAVVPSTIKCQDRGTLHLATPDADALLT